MRKNFLIKLASAAALSTVCLVLSKAIASEASVPQTKVIDGKEYRLTFHDEFNGDQLNSTEWGQRLNGPSPNRNGGMVHTEKASWLDGKGNLVLAAYSKEKKDLELEVAKDFKDRWILHTSMLRSLKNFKYGYYEFRVKMPIVKGVGMSVWFQAGGMTASPPSLDGKGGTEIDLIEQTFFDRNGSPTDYKHTTVHWGGYGKTHQYRSIDINPLPEKQQDLQTALLNTQKRALGIEGMNTSEDGLIRDTQTYYSSKLNFRDEEFHTLALLWTPEAYKFYYDGELIGAIDDGVSQAPEYIILWPRPFSYGKLTGNTEYGLGDRETTHAKYLVDYCRIYQLEEPKK